MLVLERLIMHEAYRMIPRLWGGEIDRLAASRFILVVRHGVKLALMLGDRFEYVVQNEIGRREF